MTRCRYDDSGKCVACGHETQIKSLVRECGWYPQVADIIHKGTPRHGASGQSMPSRESPGFLDKVKNFAAAAVSHVAAGMPMASDEEIMRRHDICLACERLIDGACADCGCPVSRVRSFISKLSWADQECPRGKWGKAKNSH